MIYNKTLKNINLNIILLSDL